jgi:hypothetical protein
MLAVTTALGFLCIPPASFAQGRVDIIQIYESSPAGWPHSIVSSWTTLRNRNFYQINAPLPYERCKL